MSRNHQDIQAEIRRMLADAPALAIALHSNADLDCVGSAAALALFFGNGRLMSPGGVSHLGKRLLAALDMDFEQDIEIGQEEIVVLVDASGPSSLGYGLPDLEPHRTVILDHHPRSADALPGTALIDEEANSTCEIVWQVLGMSPEIGRRTGLALASGILADTGHLRRGGPGTLDALSGILAASGMDLEDVATLLESAEDQDISRRMARLKGAQRLKFHRTGDWLVAVSEVGAFEGAVCHGLIGLGADVSLVGSQKEDDFRITGRGTARTLAAGVHLGDIMSSVADEIGGQGGGHDGAAGLSGTGEAEAMLDICARNVLDVLRGTARH